MNPECWHDACSQSGRQTGERVGRREAAEFSMSALVRPAVACVYQSKMPNATCARVTVTGRSKND